MDYSALIHDFVDGTMDSGKENELFSELALNPNLRSELKQFIDFERAARFDNDAYTPASESTAHIFKTLNIDLAGTIPQPAPSKPFISSLLGKYSLPIICSFASVITTVIVMLMLQKSDNHIIQSSNNIERNVDNSILAQGQNNTNKSSLPAIQSNDANEVKSEMKPQVIIKYIDRPVYLYKTVDAGNSIPDDNISAMDTKAISMSEVSLAETSESIERLQGINKIIYQEPLQLSNEVNPMEFSIPSTLLEDFSLSITGNEYWQFPKSPVPKSSEPIFENLSMQLYYQLSKELLTGLDVRQEFFYQKYDGYEADGQYNYYQYTNYISIGGLIRYQPFSESIFSPFGEIYIGGNKVGAIGRLLVGIELSPVKGYCFAVGLEGSLLGYYHSDNVQGTKYFFSPKLGLHYGIRFK